MKINGTVKKIIENYQGESTGVKIKLAHMLGNGITGGTGRMLILPVDQGMEHGPARSFAVNPAAYDPDYHFRLANSANMSAIAAPLGFLQSCADSFAGSLPMILKANSSNSLTPTDMPKDQAITATVDDALRIGASAIGFTIYPGSSKCNDLMEEITEMRSEAAAKGMATVIWSYPRGEALEAAGETALDVTAYAAHMAASLGAHIIKVKLPTDELYQDEAATVYKKEGVLFNTLEDRVRHIVQACYNGRRLVVFSGGGKKDDESLLQEVEAIRAGGGNGSIIGRNSFQRPRPDALELLDKMAVIYRTK